MSAIGAALSRALGTLGGPPMAAAIVAGGLLAGVVGGGLVGGGGGQPANASGSLAVYACPDSGAPLAKVQAGQRLLATGRTEDSTWLRIHFPEPGRTEAWVQAGPLQVKGVIADLPVAGCAPEVAGVLPPFEPGPSLTAIVGLPDPTPSPAGPTAVPTPTATGTPDEKPAITALTVSTAKISYDTDAYCPKAAKTATFTVKASDDVGLARVTLFWRAPGASAYAQAAMTRVAGSVTKGTWEVALNAGSGGITKAGRLSYYAVATDKAGATKRLPQGSTDSIAVDVCENEGPEITQVTSLSGDRLFWDPLSAGNCQTATDITAVIKDVDGVRSATLFYRRPGDSGWASKPMDDGVIRGRWYANLDSLGDKITIPSPPTGTLRWYIKAVDDTGKTSQTSTRAMTIKRCDTEANFIVNSIRTQYSYGCPSNLIRLTWSFSIEDPDTIESARLTFRITNNSTGRTFSETITTPVTSQRFGMASKEFDGSRYDGDNNVVRWTITTFDRYDGRSSQSSESTVYLFVC